MLKAALNAASFKLMNNNERKNTIFEKNEDFFLKETSLFSKLYIFFYFASMVYLLPDSVAVEQSSADRRLLEWDESRRVGGTDTGSTVSNGLVGHGEFGEVVANHFGLDFDLVED